MVARDPSVREFDCHKYLFFLTLPCSCSGIAIASSVAASRSSMWSAWAGLPRFVVDVEYLLPLGDWRMWPIFVASLTPMWLLIAAALRLGNPYKYPAFAAVTRVCFGCEQREAW